MKKGKCLLHEGRMDRLIESIDEIMPFTDKIEISMKSRAKNKCPTEDCYSDELVELLQQLDERFDKEKISLDLMDTSQSNMQPQAQYADDTHQAFIGQVNQTDMQPQVYGGLPSNAFG